MASRADVQAFQRSTADLYAVVDAEVRRFWHSVDTSTPEAARVALDRFLPELVATYGEAAALIAADFFDRLRDGEAARGTFSATMADPAPVGQVQGANRWAVGPLNGSDGAQALANVLAVARRLTVQPARLTIAHSAAVDPARPKWARVPTGAHTCAFCLALASRGFAYHSEKTARFKNGAMNKYHADCDCTPVPDWSGDPRLEGYDPDALYDQYAQARSDSGSNSLKPILSQLRQQEGIA